MGKMSDVAVTIHQLAANEDEEKIMISLFDYYLKHGYEATKETLLVMATFINLSHIEKEQ